MNKSHEHSQQVKSSFPTPYFTLQLSVKAAGAAIILEIIKISVMPCFSRRLILLLSKYDEHSPVSESISSWGFILWRS